MVGENGSVPVKEDGTDYIYKMSDGSIVVECNNLPEHAFVDAIRVREICRARMLTRNDKQKLARHGEPDVMITNNTGENYYVSRKEFIEQFTYNNGRRIIIPFLRSGIEYGVIRNRPSNFKVMKIPSNCKGLMVINGRRKNVSGRFIVVPVLPDGKPDMSCMKAIEPRLFRKQFKIPMNEVIERNLNSKRREFGLFKPGVKERRLANVTKVKNTINMSKVAEFVNGMKSDDGYEDIQIKPTLQKRPQAQAQTQTIKTPPLLQKQPPVQDRTPSILQKQPPVQGGTPPLLQKQPQVQGGAPSILQKQPQVQQRPTSALNKLRQGPTLSGGPTVQTGSYKYRATHQIKGLMSGKMVGLKLQEIDTGKERAVQIKQVEQMGLAHLIENIEVVTNSRTGQTYLRGNGIKLENLPELLVQG